MTNFVSFLADLTDPTFATREVDLNGFEAGLSVFETAHETFDLGAPVMDGVWLSEAGKDEDVLSAHRRGRVEASFDLRIAPRASNTLPNLTIQLQNLNRALDRSGVWVVQQPGLASPLFIDYYPSPLIQQLMPGQRSLYQLWSQLQQPNGMRVTIIRRPKMRGAALDYSINTAHNGTMAEDHDADGEPTFWSWDSLTGITFPGEGYDWTYGAHEVLIQTASTRFFSQDADDDVVVAGQSYTFAIDVSASYSALPSVRARIDWLDNLGAVIGSPILGTAVSLLFNPTLAFSRPSVSGVAPVGAVGARYGIQFVDQNTNPVHAWIRNAQFEYGTSASAFRPGFETISNDVTQPFGKRLWLVNTWNADALGELRAAPDAAAEIAAMRYSRRSGERDSAMSMRYLPGWHAVDSDDLMSGSTDVSGESDTLSGHALKSALDDDVMRPLLRHAMLPSEESAARGTWVFRAAVRGDLDDAYQLEMRIGFGDVEDLPIVGPRRRLDLVDPPSESDYYEIDLGFVQVPQNSPGIYFELHAFRETTDDGDGDGELYVDQIWPEPADDDMTATAVIPGALTPGLQTETLRGDSLVTPPDSLADDPDSSDPFEAGEVYNTDMWLNDTLEAASLPASWTDDLSATEHTFVATVHMYTADEKQARKHGEFRVHDLTADVQVAKTNMSNTKGVPWTHKSFTVRFTPTAGHAYLVYVVQTVSISVGNIHVDEIAHSFVRGQIDGDQTIAVDADQRRAYILEGDQFAGNFPLAGPFPTLMPRIQLVRISLAGLGPNGSDSVLDGRPALRHDPARTIDTGVHMIPRTFN